MSRPHDAAETQADKAADVVARGGSVSGWSFGSVPVEAGVHREEKGKPPSDEEELKEAAKKVGEAALETKAGKDLQEKVTEDPLVKGATKFLDTTAGKVVAGGAVAAGVGALAAAKQPLPFQAPAIPLDKVTPGLSAKVTVEGPVNAPTFVGLSLTYKEQGPKGKGPTEKDQIAADIARLKAQQEMFKPQAQKDQEKADEQAAIAHVLAQQSKRFGNSTLLPLNPADKPKTVEVPKPESDAPKKEQDEAPLQREPAPATEAAHDSVDTSGVEEGVRGAGRALDPATRRSMEARFGYDFSSVRIHDDASASIAAAGVAANAFTVGSHIAFASGRHDPSSCAGIRLLAHELAHVVQQEEPDRKHDVTGPVGPGRPLEKRLREEFEPLLGVDLGEVRIHDEGDAARGASARCVRAYTVGKDVCFASGQYRPETADGRWVLGHELAHVAQASGATREDGESDVESDASAAATAVMRGRPASLRSSRLSTSEHCLGEPDHVPDLTFVSTAGEQGFLNQAVRFHQTWGLAPARFSSMQNLLHTLAENQGAISRLRIVSHANYDNIFTPLFAGGANGITENDLTAYGESEATGLARTLGGPLIDAKTRGQVLDAVRTASPGVLQPFGLQAPGAAPTGVVARLVEASVDLLAIRTATGAIPQNQRATLEAARTAQLADLRNQVQQAAPVGAGVTAAQAQDLQQAITSVTQFNFNLPAQPGGFIAAVASATAGLSAGFRADLTVVRGRLSGASWIDLRGCRVGQRPAYLAAVARFFGVGTVLPHVSGPDLWQSYPTLGFQTVRATDLRARASNADVRAALNHWAEVTGIRERFMWWLRFLDGVLREEGSRLANPTPPGLLGNLQLRLDPILTGTLGGLPPDPTSLPRLASPAFTPPRLASPGIGIGQLRNPLVETAMREIPRYTAPDGELRYYLEAGLPLPVQAADNPQDIRLYFLVGREREAIDTWLASEWAPAAPGLPALQQGSWGRNELRQVEAVSNLDARRRTTEMYVSPDPLYAAHIQST